MESLSPPRRGRAWWTIILTALTLLLTGCQRDGSPAPNPQSSSSVPQSQDPSLRFLEDISSKIGLHFLHDSSAAGKFFMPEQAGSGVAVLDFDQDGLMDLYLVQCGGPAGTNRNVLLHHEPDGTLRDVTAGSGLDLAGFGMGAIAADPNNDGQPDLFVTEYGRIHLLLNLGAGRFTNVTGQAGLENARWATAAAFLDYDRNGWLDLVVANYLDYNPTHKCADATGAPEYCGPQNFPGTVTRLFRNRGIDARGQLQFEDVTVPSGLAKAIGPALGILCADFSGDQWPDIFLADDGQPNRLFVNQHNGTFLEEAALRGLAYNAMGATAGNMGIAAGDVNQDGLFDLFVTHLTEEQHTLWIQNPKGLFQDQTAAARLANPAWRGTGFGTVLADFDHNTTLDLAFVNGRVLRGHDPAPRVQGLDPQWFPYAQRYQLFRNDGSGKFVDIASANPDFCSRAAVGRALAVLDFNNDGALDLLSTSTGGPAQLFKNVASSRGHWLGLRLTDPAAGNRDALGAEIVLVTGSRRQWRLLQPSSSYLSSHDPRIHFGLGTAQSYDAIRILWPDGTEEQFPGGLADRFLDLRKGTGTPSASNP